MRCLKNNIFHSFVELMATSKGKARSSETVGELWVNAGWFPCMMTPMRKAKCSLKTCLFLTTTSTTNFKFIQSQMIKCCYFLSISHEQHSIVSWLELRRFVIKKLICQYSIILRSPVSSVLLGQCPGMYGALICMRTLKYPCVGPSFRSTSNWNDDLFMPLSW